MIDSHAHLNDAQFKDKIDSTIQNAMEVGVKEIMVPGWDVNSSIDAIKIAETHKGIIASVGIHPENIEGITPYEVTKLVPFIQNPKVKAIGEIGLDYHWRSDNKESQKIFLLKQLDLARLNHLPVIIHERDATEDFLNIIRDYIHTYGKSPNIGIMHSFSGSKETMKELIEYGFYISFSGPVTFKNAKNLKECAILCPLNRILSETDSPYLSPIPHRGEMNEPKNVIFVLDEIANLKGIDSQELEEIITENYHNVFNLKEDL